MTFAQAESLRLLLSAEGPRLPVYVGMRHWEPYITDTLTEMAHEGRRRAVGVVLAAHRSPPSWEAYLASVDEARGRLGDSAPVVDYVAAWSDHPLLIEALAERTLAAIASVPEARRGRARIVFTAHSIPTGMAERSGYTVGLRRTAGLLAGRLGVATWSLAFTSRSGNPSDPWLEPDIGDALRTLQRDGAQDVVVSPIGFLSDHVEVLYDLDIAARRTADGLGIGFFRAGTPGDHPSFIRMLAHVVRDMVTGG